jgi:putative nucleotide binding protein
MLVEDYVLVLDYIPKSRSTGFKEETSAQVIGERYFTLLEVIPKAELKPLEKVYIGKDQREKIEFIKRRIGFSDLTSASQAEIENAVEKIIEDDKARFVGFFNTSTSITLRRHQLELLPSLGKKHLMDILNEREKKPFESFEEIKQRVQLMPDPKKIIVKRVLEELQDESLKHYLFARPPKKPHEDFRGR